MKSIERRVLSRRKRDPYHSSFIIFARAIKGCRFSPETIRRWFNRLVDKDDYAQSEKKGHLRYLVELSNPVRTTGIEGKFAPTAAPKIIRVTDVVCTLKT